MNSQHPAPEPNNFSEEPQPPRKNSRPLIWAVAAGLGALGILGLLFSRPEPGPPDPPWSTQPTPAASPDSTGGKATQSTNPLSDSFSEPQLILFVPDDNGDMKKSTLAPRGDIPSEPRAAREKLSAQAVQALMQAAPDIFPPGTILQSVTMDGSAATLNFNAAMAKPGFWQGSALTKATLDALALTVAATKNQIPGDNTEGVRISVEGKPLPLLGEMDLSQPYTPSAKAPPGSGDSSGSQP